MKSPSAMLRASAAAFLLLPHATSAIADATNPISKVVELISNLQAKILADGESAQKVFKEFSEWCEDRSANVGYEIETGKNEVMRLKAAIDNAGATIGAAEAKIEDLASSITTDESDLKAARAIRAKESEDFMAEDKDLVDTIDTLERAIGLIQREMKKGGAMLQFKRSDDLVKALTTMVDASMIGAQDASRLSALVQRSKEDDGLDDDPPPGAPAAATYSSHSGGIIETLEDLLEKAKTQLDDARAKETSSRHNFELLEQSLSDEIANSNKELADSKKGLASAGIAKAGAEGDLSSTSKGLEEDVKVQSDLHRTCLERSRDFEAETKSRGEELKVLAEAKKVLLDNTAGAQAVVYDGAADDSDEVSFVQTDSSSSTAVRSRTDLVHFEALQLVRSLARRDGSKELGRLAKRMSLAFRAAAASGADPFAKVKSLIKDMLEKLLKEAGSEATHKAYCDKEMAETTAKLSDKNAAIDKLSTQIDSMTAKSQQLKSDVASLQKALAELSKSQATMDKIRMEEHEVFVNNKADVEQGLEGVKLGLQVLREYYAQEAQHDTSEGAGNGIIGMLEVVESDLTKNLAEMRIEEQSAQSEYDSQTQENKISRATKEQSVEYKTKESKSLDVSSSEATSDRQSELTERIAVQEYDAKLKQMCVAKAEPYEERSRRRAAEIAGLKQALEILKTQTAVSFLQGASSLRGLRRHVQ